MTPLLASLGYESFLRISGFVTKDPCCLSISTYLFRAILPIFPLIITSGDSNKIDSSSGHCAILLGISLLEIYRVIKIEGRYWMG
jgi:hypothetical protein